MQALHDEGRIAYTKSGMPQYKRYLDEMPGTPLTSVWTDIPPINSQAQERLGYPTQKPLPLLERIITSSSKPGDVVLDPFFGTGTTGAVAKRLGRHFIGIERDPTYCDVALERIAAALPLDESAVTTMMAPTAATRVAFGTLVETGLLVPGSEVFDAKRRWVAKVRADGSLMCGAQAGTIHKLGALLQAAPSCNGWTFWHYADGDIIKPIDALRQTYLLSTEP
jgi:modification methylase